MDRFPMRKLGLSVFAAGFFFLGFLLATGMVDRNRFTVVSNPAGMYDREQLLPSYLHQEASDMPMSKTAHKDVIDDSGASSLLQTYTKLFAKKGESSKVDPGNPKTVTKWWEAAAMIDWYIHSPLRYKCQNKVAYGNWHVCQDQPYSVKPPCLVYSFGIAFDFSFDDAMGKLGCEVHSFDPSMKKEDHQRNQNVTFHNMGLGNINTNAFDARKDMYVTNEQNWKLRTLKSVMRELGHSNRVIDVLKIDVEGHEWGVVDNLMETGIFDQVRHFMLEFHLFKDWPSKDDFVYCYNIYRRLRELGFREYSIGPHPKTLKADDFNNQGDSEFINYYFNYTPRS